MSHSHSARVVLVVIALAAATLVTSAVQPPPAEAGADCTAPVTNNVRGKMVTLDQCYAQQQDIGGTTYEVEVFYRETALQANTDQCTAADYAGRCEHELTDNDNASGDNVVAVSIAQEGLSALAFYVPRDLAPMPPGTTTLKILVAEDPRGGGVIPGDTLYWDDELVETGGGLFSNVVLGRRALAYHESMHLIQARFDGTIGWNDFYGEGIARSIEDRVDPGLDAFLGGLFMPEVNGILGSQSNRTADLSTINYRSVLWWTWLWDQYRTAGDTSPVIGWDSIKDFYDELAAGTNQLDVITDFISGNGSSFYADHAAYAESLWAYRFNPPIPRADYLDAEINASGNQLSGHPVINSGPAYPSNATVPVNPRSTNYFEFNPASQCDFTRIDFDGNGKTFTYAVMAADGGAWVDGWESTGTEYTRTVRTTSMDRLAGLVAGRNSAGSVDVARGCVSPTLNIKSPTTAAFAMVGTADNPRTFITRLAVTSGGGPVAGLLAGDFTVSLVPLGGGTPIPASIVTSTYVQDDYWLLVQAPDTAAGAVTGTFYDLNVTLGSAADTENQSVVYLERTQDSVIVLDRSGSMLDSDKIQAARNAANLYANVLADQDQGAFVAFDTDADLRVQLAEMGSGNQRSDMATAISNEATADFTSIGDGMRTAATEEDTRGDPDHVCNFVLLSDGYENEPELWADARPDVVDNGCPIHSIALGPEANEPLMQQIAGSVSGGSYDYATDSGDVPIGGGSSFAGAGSIGSLGWQNNLGRIYDYAATLTSGRQRIFAAEGNGVRDSSSCQLRTTVSYGDLPASPPEYTVGQSFVSDLVTHTVRDFAFTNGQSTADGFAFPRTAGLDGPDMGTNNVRLEPTLPADTCEVRVRFTDQGGSENLTVNGVNQPVDDLVSLDGTTLGGASIAVTFDQRSQLGSLTVTGNVRQFAIGGQEFAIDDLRISTSAAIPQTEGFSWFVDDAADELVVTFSWQQPQPGDGPAISVIDPDGTPVPTTRQRIGANGLNQVWTIPNPAPGGWTAEVNQLPVEYLVTAQVRSLFELHAYTGAPIADTTGQAVPILASFSRPGGPVLGATVTALVTSPSGAATEVKLFDDGNHGDGGPDDGVYGGTYLATEFGDAAADAPAEGEEPQVVGSYLVDVTGVSGQVRREAQASFALRRGGDSDGDQMPDDYERRYGLDPNDPADARGDLDLDLVSNLCELRLGSRPDDPDSDDGGESDGSELGFPTLTCSPTGPVGNPMDPTNDALEPVTILVAQPFVDEDGPHVRITWTDDQPDPATFDLTRRCVGPDGTARPPLTRRDVSPVLFDRTVEVGDRCTWTLTPRLPNDRLGPPLDTVEVEVTDDPFPPDGTILIDGGAYRTDSTMVDLELTVDDTGSAGDGAPDAGAVPGTAVGDLEMRISNEPDLGDATYGPFVPTVSDWDLGDVAPGTHTAVYVQFRDPAGNESTPRADTILFAGDSRLGGPDRIQTGTTISGASFEDGAAEVVILARADVFADALAGTPLAIGRHGPLLLTDPAGLSAATATELARVLPAGRTVYLLGGTAALSTAVEQAIADLGYEPVRLAGGDRYQTAAAIADQLGDVEDILIATGEQFPDALAAGAAAGHIGGAVVLTPSGSPNAATDAYLARHPSSTRWAVGGPAAAAYPDASSLVGQDRFETAVAVADEFFDAPEFVGVARADNFADSLGGGVHIGLRGGPIMLTNTDALVAPTEAYLCSTDSLSLAFTYGGTAAVQQGVADTITDRIGGIGC